MNKIFTEFIFNFKAILEHRTMNLYWQLIKQFEFYFICLQSNFTYRVMSMFL